MHPAHYAIRAIEKAHYRLVAVTKGYTDYRASFLVRGHSNYASLSDSRIKQVGMPDADSITAWIVRATLYQALGAKAKALRLRIRATRMPCRSWSTMASRRWARPQPRP